MNIQKFEDLICWQKSQDFAVEIYNNFRNLKDWDFRNQITSAVVSISNNIAEGFDRRTNPDFIKFLNYALTSCSEVKSMLYLAPRIDFISIQKSTELISQASEISKIITGLIKSIENRIITNN